MQHLNWNSATLGREYNTKPLTETSDDFKIIRDKRFELIDQISGLDDELAELVISSEGFDAVGNDLIQRALKRCVLQQKIVPVFLGSAYKNVGVQSLMDAVIQYLPAPYERNSQYDCFEYVF